LGLAYIVSNLDEEHELRVLDLMFSDGFEEETRNAIEEFDPDLIGISIRNVDDQNYLKPRFFLPEMKEIVRICRDSSNAKIVLGGSAFCIFPDEILRYLNTDMGIIGEGERVFNDLIRKMEEGDDYSHLPGLVMTKGNNIMINEPQQIESFDEVKMPDRNLLDVERYCAKMEVYPHNVTIQSKRGCPMDCIYCPNPLIEGKSMRIRSPKNVVSEIEMLKDDFGIDEISFVDCLFNYPLDHAESVCREIIERELDISWDCTFNPAFTSRRLIELMKKAGCTDVMVGNESGSAKMLNSLKKGFSIEDVERCCSYFKDVDMGFRCFLLIGGPGEDRDTVEETVSLMERLDPNIVYVTIGIRVYPGCEITKIVNDLGRLNQQINTLLRPTFYLSPAVEDWIFNYMREITKRNRKWIL
jgi:radical SAM superfamily enzyme YgiQ (UPF0313 family)